MTTYLRDLTFDYEPDADSPLGAHISYTTASVGGAASKLNKPILLKAEDLPKSLSKEAVEVLKAAKEVRVELSMEEFLRRFMGLFYSDSQLLATLFGYEVEADEWEEDWLESKLEGITLLKSLKADEDFYELEATQQIQLLRLQETFEKALGEKQEELIEYFAKKLAENPEPKALESLSEEERERVLEKARDNANPHKGQNSDNPAKEGVSMSEKETKDLEGIVKSLQDEKDRMQKELDALKLKEDARVEKAFIAKAADFSFAKDKAEKLGKVLKALSEEDALLVLEVLGEAKQEIEKAEEGMFVRKSLSGEREVPVEKQREKEAVAKELRKQLKLEEGDND